MNFLTIYAFIAGVLSLFYQIVCAGLLFDAKKDVSFEFFSSGNFKVDRQITKGVFDENDNYKINIPDSFDVQKQTFIYIHGYMSPTCYQNIHIKMFFDNIMRPDNKKYNFIVVNWTDGNMNPAYPLMIGRSRGVAEVTFEFLKALRIQNNLRLETVTIVGHSIGAHIAGIVAEMFLQLMLEFIIQIRSLLHANYDINEIQRPKESNNQSGFSHLDQENRHSLDFGLIGIIVAVDAAGTFYRKPFPDGKIYRVKPGYAIYTSVIHTNASIYGLEWLMGDADFFPDGGVVQSFCGSIFSVLPIWDSISICSHKSAGRMYWRTLKDHFLAVRCDSHEAILNYNICEQNLDEIYEMVNMGGNLHLTPFHKRPRGVFYTETTGKNYDNINPAPVAKYTSIASSVPIIWPKFDKVCLSKKGENISSHNWVNPNSAAYKKILQQRGEMMTKALSFPNIVLSMSMADRVKR